MIVNNPEAAYNLCQDYLPDCSEPMATEYREQHDDFNAGYRGADSSDILDREGLAGPASLSSSVLCQRLNTQDPGFLIPLSVR